MSEYQSKEGVALDLVKYIYATNGGDSRPEAVLNLYAECLGVVDGRTLELTRAMLNREKAQATQIS